MVWTDCAADLPAPRDDEPAHLRQDIHDELADHLQSALERELRQGADEGAACGRVLERFGDPRRVARKLWQDAMWEKLMSQRILVAMAGMMLAVCLGLFALTWSLATQSRELNQALLAELRAVRQTVNPEWNPVTVQLVTETGAPVPKGYKVNLARGQDFDDTQEPDAEGKVDFGLVRSGDGVLIVTAPWGEFYSDRFAVRAGKPTSLKLVCPSGADIVNAPVKVEWPAGFEPPADVWVAGQAILEEQRLDGREWNSDSESLRFLTNARGQTIEFPPKSVVGGDWIVSMAVDRSGQYGDSFGLDVKLGEPVAVDREPTLQLPKEWEGEVVVRILGITKGTSWSFTKLNDSATLRLEWRRGAQAHWVVKIPPEVVGEVMQARDKMLLHGQGWADRGLPPPDLPPNYVPNGVESSQPGYSPPTDDLPPGPQTVPEPIDQERPLPPGAPAPLYNEPSTPADEAPGREPDAVRARSPAGRG